jgi:hypothetical protein
VPRDPFIREKFTKEQTAARKLAKEYFQRYPKDRYQTEVENWRHLQSANIEFTMKRLREPIEAGDQIRRRIASRKAAGWKRPFQRSDSFAPRSPARHA